jgi:hypothetical protein
MKKLILFLGLLFIAVGLFAQSGTVVTMGNVNTAKYTPVAADTVNGTSATSKYWIFLVNKPCLYYYVVTARVDAVTTTSRSAGSHCILTMAGSIDGTNYITMDTTLFHPTTGNFSLGTVHTVAYDVSTGVLWKYIKFTLVPSDANKGAKLYSLAIATGNRY